LTINAIDSSFVHACMHSTIEWLKLLWVCLLRCFLRLDKMNLPQFMKFRKNENKENLTSSWFWVDGGLESSSFWKYVWKLGCTIIFFLWLLNIQTLYIWHWKVASLHLPLLMIFPNKFKSCRPPSLHLPLLMIFPNKFKSCRPSPPSPTCHPIRKQLLKEHPLV